MPTDRGGTAIGSSARNVRLRALIILSVVMCPFAPALAQSVTCRAELGSGQSMTGQCVQGDSVVALLVLERPARSTPHLWMGTIRGTSFGASASGGPVGESKIGFDARPGGALRLGRSWLALREVQSDSVKLQFTFHFDRDQRATEVDARILERAHALLPDISSWNRRDTTDMAAAPTKGFGCTPATRQSMFCALYRASLEVVGDYAHFRPAINSVRQALGAASKKAYRHPLVDFNNDAATTLRGVRNVLDSAIAITRRDAATCDRPCLSGVADDYLAALVARDPSRVAVARELKVTENGAPRRLGEGLWRTASKLGAYRLYVLDADSSSVAVQTVLRDADTDVQILLRLKAPGGLISEVELLVAREGDTCCWDLDALRSLSPTYAQPLAPAQSAPRQDMIATADKYFTALQTSGTTEYSRAPMRRGMNRYENGLLTTNVPGGGRLLGADATTQFDSAMFGPIRVVDRRYAVVDRVNGTLLAIVLFESPNPARKPTIISEFFKISDREIHEIRAVMVSSARTGWR